MLALALIAAAAASAIASSQVSDHCLAEMGRGIEYSTGTPVVSGTLTGTSPIIDVVRGENEPLFVLVPGDSESEDAAGPQVSGAHPLLVDTFVLAPVLTEAGTPVFDVLMPPGAKRRNPGMTTSRAYLVLLGVPADAAARDYEITLTTGGCSEAVTVRVHDVDLPAQDDLVVQAAIDPPPAEASPESADEQARFALGYGINSFAGAFPKLTPANAGAEWAKITTAMLESFIADPAVRYFRMPVSQYHRNSTYADRTSAADNGKFGDKLAFEMSPYQFLLDDPLLREKLILKLWDEPLHRNYEEVVHLYSVARSLYPDIPLELAEQPERALGDIADIWTIHIDYLRAPDVQAVHAAGQSALLYANALHALRRDTDAMRSIGWLLWRFELDGYHFWRLNWWNADPWSTRSSWENDFDKSGTLFYPGEAGNLLASVRLLMFREGLEDRRLLRALQNCNPAGAEAWLDALVSRIRADANDPVDTNLIESRGELLTRLARCE